MRRAGLLVLAIAALTATGCGQAAGGRSSTARASDPVPARSADPAPVQTVPQAHPQAIEPVAGQATPAAPAAAPQAAAVSVGPTAGLAQPVPDSVIRQQLTQSGLTADANQATLTPDGLAIPPIDAPWAVQEVIAAGNEIAHLPYRWGGGHVTYEDTAYDCSGSISFVFDAAHLLNGPVVSGDLMNWGAPGPGKWITIFANAGHTFMYVAGLRFDTVALAETGDRWSTRSANEPDLSTFSVRHPPGL